MKSCYEAKYRRAATQEVLENMSDAEKSRLITESVTQTTLHFEKRVVKLVREFLKPGWFQDDCEDDFEEIVHHLVPRYIKVTILQYYAIYMYTYYSMFHCFN